MARAGSTQGTDRGARPGDDGRATAVELDGVTKRFGEIVAVDGIDLTIDNGEFFSLLGPSGCGKTTTLRMIAGLEYPSAGSIRIFGEDMGLRPPNRRAVNTVFQSYALFPHMTVAQNVAFGLEAFGREEAREGMDAFLEKRTPRLRPELPPD